MSFPPIFAYVIFFVLDLIALVFYLLGITGPIGALMTTFTTGLYAIWVFTRYGFTKGKEKLFKYRNVPRKKVMKKVAKVFGSSVIPFLTVWAVYDDYKEETREKSGQGEEGFEEKKESKKSKLLKGAALTAATVATGGTAGVAAAGTRAAAGRAAAGTAAKTGAKTAATTKVSTETSQSIVRNTSSRIVRDIGDDRVQNIVDNVTEEEISKKTKVSKERDINPWIKRSSVGGKKDPANKTIAEEVSGIKTGLKNPEDYKEDLLDFSRPETYTKLVEEREQNKKEEEQKRKEIETTRLVQRQREKVEQEKAFDRAFIRRFGTKAYERMVRDRELRKGKRGGSTKNETDKYRETA